MKGTVRRKSGRNVWSWSLVAKVVAHTVGGQRLQAVTAADVQRLLADLRNALSARGKGTATLSPI